MFKRISVAVMMVTSALVWAGSYDKPGFVTKVEDGRLWVFKAGSKELADMEKSGLPAVHVSKIGEGPEGMTLKAVSNDILDAYLNTK